MAARTNFAWPATCILLVCAFAILAALYWPTVLSLFAQWRTSTFSYGFIVLPAAGYLAWRRREELARLSPSPTFWGLPILAILAFAWLLGNLTGTAVIQQFSLIAMIVVFISAEAGVRAARVLLFSLAFLFFAVPMGEALIPTLQDFSAWLAVKLLELSNVPVLLEGRFISVPYGKWEVAEACSGIRYLLASLAVGFLYAGLMYRSWTRRVVFLVASALVLLLANGLRVYGTILAGHLLGGRTTVRIHHVFAAFLFFAIINILLMVLGLFWREDSSESLSGPASGRDCGNTGDPLASQGSASAVSMRRVGLFWASGLLIAALGPLSARILLDPKEDPVSLRATAPRVSPPWKPTSLDVYDWKPQFIEPSAEVIQSYQSGNAAVKLYVAFYSSRQPGVKLVSSGNTLFDRIKWQRSDEGIADVSVQGKTLEAHRTAVQSAQSSLIVWNWYLVDGMYTSNAYLTKLLLAKARLTRSHRPIAAIAIAAEEAPAQRRAAAILQDFLNHLSLQPNL